MEIKATDQKVTFNFEGRLQKVQQFYILKVMPGKSRDWMWLVRFIVVLGVVGVRLIWHQNWIGETFLVLGWLGGYMLGELDQLFYVAVCGPQELSCQRVRTEFMHKNWRGGWQLLRQTAGERTRLPMHNILTAGVVTILGLWLVTSNGNLFAIGVVTGLAIRLFSEFIADPNYGKWYWLIAREFSSRENRIVTYVWGGLLALHLFWVIRG